MSEPSANPVRRALRALTHGVYVLSVNHEQRDDYLVVSLAMQCSVEPPLVALALSLNARILRAFCAAGGGVLGILDADARAAVRRYGTPGGVRQPPVNPGRTNSLHAIPPEVSFWLDLRIAQEIRAGDSMLFVAHVAGAGVRSSPSQPAAPSGITADPTANSPALSDVAPFRALTLADSGFPYAG